MPEPILTLTTDFGAADHYAAAMKGVILDICPRARIVDITHLVEPYNIAQGAYLIAQAWRAFPRKTVHVVVVDPGVGTARRPILMEAGGHLFVAPDNGVLSMIYSSEKHRIRLISAERYFRQPVSHTFHGRDIFAPVAAHMAAGVPPSRMGKPVDDYLRAAFDRAERTGKRTWTGTILHIDRFGNLVTSLRARDFPDLEQRGFALRIGPREVVFLAHNYAECPPGEVFAIEGSSGYLEVSANHGSAAALIGCQAGAPVELVRDRA
jgi:S-adenosylmethionine hydrolase